VLPENSASDNLRITYLKRRRGALEVKKTRYSEEQIINTLKQKPNRKDAISLPISATSSGTNGSPVSVPRSLCSPIAPTYFSEK
jgi:hypothetical protein